jgi:hypothetical protein
MQPLTISRGEERPMASRAAAAAVKRARCLELVTAGWKYDDIATEVGDANRGSVSKAIWKELNIRTATGCSSTGA